MYKNLALINDEILYNAYDEKNVEINNKIIDELSKEEKVKLKFFIEYVNNLIKLEKRIIQNFEEEDETILKVAEDEEKYYIEDMIHNFHDTSIRKILSNKNEAAIFINKALGITNTNVEIKPENLIHYESSLILKNYSNREADIIYKRKDMDVFFLIEHQSRIDYDMPIRIIEYMTGIITNYWYAEKNKNHNKKYPLVIPIVLYIGKKKWNVSRSFESRQEKMPGYNEKYGSFKLIDANDYTNQELIKEKSVLSKIILLEKTDNEEELQENYKKISKETFSQKEKEMIIEYLCNVSSIRLSKAKVEKIKKSFMKGERSMLAEIFIEKERKAWLSGKKEGIERGIERGMKKGIETGIERGIKKGIETGIERGMKKGIEKGERESKIKIAKKLVRSKININQIKEWTNLSEKEINNIIANEKDN